MSIKDSQVWVQTQIIYFTIDSKEKYEYSTIWNLSFRTVRYVTFISVQLYFAIMGFTYYVYLYSSNHVSDNGDMKFLLLCLVINIVLIGSLYVILIKITRIIAQSR